MTVQATVIGWTAGAVAAATYIYWLWSMDKELPREHADAGRGLSLPLYRNDSGSVGWWGASVLLVSDAVVLASFAFAYLFLWTARPGPWPPDGSRMPGFVEPGAVAAVILLAWFVFEAAGRYILHDRRLAASVSLAAAAILAGAALVMGWFWLGSLGTDPTRHSYGASVWTLAGFAGLHLAIGAVMALWCITRIALRMLDAWRCLTLRICLLWWRFTAPAAVFTLILVAGFPNVVS